MASNPVTMEMLETVAKAMAQANSFTNVDVGVERKGVKMILPETMSYEQGIDCLQRKIKEESTVVTIHEEIDAFPLDGAYALMEVLKRRYGWAQAEAKVQQSMFGAKKTPPTLVNLEIGYGKHSQVIWGCFAVPGVEGQLETVATHKNNMPIFCISGQVLQRYRDEIRSLASEVRAFVLKNSIYNGKALRLRTTNDGDLLLNEPPNFIDTSRVNENELTFSNEVAKQVQVNLFTPIERTAECRKYKIPLKRGVLLEGKYGTGKTLTAYVTAKKAEQNGWTFIYLDRVAGLRSAINFARRYGPAVIFAEDIDRSVSGERSVAIDDILNHIDGVDSKDQELIVILTTNYVENIEKAMLRPGRLDAIISVTPPDAKAAERLVRLYARDLIDEDESLVEAGKELDGQIPAVIREVVERSKLSAIYRIAPGDPLQLTAGDLVLAAQGMKRHLELMQPEKAPTLTPEAQVGAAMKNLLGLNGHGKMIEDTLVLVDKVHARVVNA